MISLKNIDFCQAKNSVYEYVAIFIKVVLLFLIEIAFFSPKILLYLKTCHVFSFPKSSVDRQKFSMIFLCISQYTDLDFHVNSQRTLNKTIFTVFPRFPQTAEKLWLHFHPAPVCLRFFVVI